MKHSERIYLQNKHIKYDQKTPDDEYGCVHF